MNGGKKLMSTSQIVRINLNDNHIVRHSFKHANNIVQTTFKHITFNSDDYCNLNH